MPSHDSATPSRRGRPAKPIECRFWPKVRKTESCWVWIGALNSHGYGYIEIGPLAGRGRHVVYAHRISWEFAHGSVPDGLCVLHHCDNPPCVRPDHLFLGTREDNYRDMCSKGRASLQKGPSPFQGERSYNAKLTEALVRQLRSNELDRASRAKLAKQLGVKQRTIRRAAAGITWKHVR